MQTLPVAIKKAADTYVALILHGVLNILDVCGYIHCA